MNSTLRVVPLWRGLVSSRSGLVKNLLSVPRCLHCGRPMEADASGGVAASSTRIAELRSRALLQVAGVDAAGMLQGLVTNEMEILNRGHRMRAMYAMFLNAQGRVLYDVLIYHQNHQDRPVYLVECDSAVMPDLHKHIKMYKLRKKADLSDVSSEYKVWSLFDKKQFNLPNDGVWIPDPRLSTFMYRAITSSNMTASDLSESASPVSEDDYRRYRYELGLAEGVRDLPPGEPLPLEANLVFLNGVDFTKGCYLGQELTARTHHTGVIRKRIMPVKLNSASEEILLGSAIRTEKGRNAGKFRGQMGTAGIALLRVAHSTEPLHVDLPNGTRCDMVAHIPPWWPKDVLH